MFKSIITSLSLSTTFLSAADWVQWRGPTRDGKIHKEAAPWPTSLSKENLRLLWSVDLAEGYSSPIIAGSKVFTVETWEKKTEIVRAFDRKTGKQFWDNDWAGSMRVPFYAAKNGSWVRCTPATDGKTLFVGGMRDVLVAIDVETGKEKWRRDYPSEEKTPLPSFGFVSSPLLDDAHIYVQVGTALRKINKSDGKTVWQSLADDRAMFGSAFSSPSRATIQGVDQILVQTRSTLGGILPSNGKAVWTTPVKAFRGMNILPRLPSVIKSSPPLMAEAPSCTTSPRRTNSSQPNFGTIRNVKATCPHLLSSAEKSTFMAAIKSSIASIPKAEKPSGARTTSLANTGPWSRKEIESSPWTNAVSFSTSKPTRRASNFSPRLNSRLRTLGPTLPSVVTNSMSATSKASTFTVGSKTYFGELKAGLGIDLVSTSVSPST